MPDQETLLRAVECDPADDQAWIAYIDWLEEQGDPISKVLRKALDTGTWSRCRSELFRKLKPRDRQLLACDSVERVLPYYEREYPADHRPRQLVETLRQYATGRRVAAAKADAAAACETADADGRENPGRFLAPLRAAQAAFRIRENPNNACLGAAYVEAIGRFGAEVDMAGSNQKAFKPEWRRAVDTELRWQIARVLRYRLMQT